MKLVVAAILAAVLVGCVSTTTVMQTHSTAIVKRKD